MYYADSLGFFVPPIQVGEDGTPRIAEQICGPDVKLNLIHLTAAPPPPMAERAARAAGTSPAAWTLEAVKKFRASIEVQERLAIIESAEDLKILPDSKSGVVLGLQGLTDDMGGGDVWALWHAGVRILQLTYGGPSVFGGGDQVPGAPLTYAGERILDDMELAGMILDLSHANHVTARAIVEKDQLFIARLMASHTGCHSVYSIERNLPDDVLAALDYVGIYTLTFGLHKNSNNPTEFIEHLRWAMKVCWSKVVGIGSDGFYASETEEAARRRFEVMSRALAGADPKSGAMTPRHPDFPAILQGPCKMESIFEQLVKNDFGYEVSERLLGENFREFILGALS